MSDHTHQHLVYSSKDIRCFLFVIELFANYVCFVVKSARNHGLSTKQARNIRTRIYQQKQHNNHPSDTKPDRSRLHIH